MIKPSFGSPGKEGRPYRPWPLSFGHRAGPRTAVREVKGQALSVSSSHQGNPRRQDVCEAHAQRTAGPGQLVSWVTLGTWQRSGLHGEPGSYPLEGWGESSGQRVSAQHTPDDHEHGDVLILRPFTPCPPWFPSGTPSPEVASVPPPAQAIPSPGLHPASEQIFPSSRCVQAPREQGSAPRLSQEGVLEHSSDK